MSAPTDEERLATLRTSLTNHRPNADGLQAITEVRKAALHLGAVIIRDAPNTRERALALTALEETVMWAVKGIALATGEPIPDFDAAP